MLELFESELDGDLPIRMEAMSEIAMVHDALGNFVEPSPPVGTTQEREQNWVPIMTRHPDPDQPAIVYPESARSSRPRTNAAQCLSTSRIKTGPITIPCC